MEEKLKVYGGGAKILAMLMVAGAAWSYASSYAKQIDPASMRTFSVSGDGKVVTVPDVAAFTFSVITEGGKNVSALQKENVDKVGSAIDFLKSSGVEEKDIKTQAYNVEPRYEYYSCGVTYSSKGEACPPPQIVGYTVRQSVGVKVRNFDKIGDVMAGVVEKGANSTSDFQFTIDDPTSILADARAQAIEKAKDKAEQVAKTAGFSIGKLVSIDEGGYIPAAYRNAKITSSPEVYGMGGGADSSVAVEPGSQDITVSVTLRYEIK
ncbi:hypothetical protein A3I34_02530 [Candidatus Jorgensenbacteria bacterium RIFCSPLOWO2_02_FULL_45_12]|uniref:26 kDa periplasmic immunogenic protein n=2 Tax=Candidatus Joergenseniibacteriota TaxID=1752739 RepID=A0A1F6BP85_9BACT|nr:MAG: Periplasmic immunogenic protein [Candidatus Jorgensenbacteria bacterium GW2011_GWA2_45_9]OGG38357.1 MAG: hypothetical protein A3D55_00310 [Candidatus Jorgensenbacteria bacterium RIFCSPHIGHO2_02_FULL_45_20]OGG42737.1 MAG: hypothetical protein A3I34_02530 [Candidatus Jorgensenbacteria bacterium RIFCSPLOWO2_02_FULL_45_12]